MNNALINLKIVSPDDPIVSNKFTTIFDKQPDNKKDDTTPFPIIYVN